MMAELMCGSIKDTARPCSSTCVPASSSAVLAPYEWLATVVRPAVKVRCVRASQQLVKRKAHVFDAGQGA